MQAPTCHPSPSPQDRPGFIVNRVLMPYINEAFFALMEVSGSSTRAQADAPEAGLGPPPPLAGLAQLQTIPSTEGGAWGVQVVDEGQRL